MERSSPRPQALTFEQRILESFRDGLFTLDRNWRYGYVNEAGARMANKTVDELVGNTLWECFPEVVGTPWHKIYEEVMETGVPKAFDMPYPPLNKWYKGSVYPFEDGITVCFTDNTDRMQLEEELRQSKSLLENIVQSTGSMSVLGIDREYRYLFFNHIHDKETFQLYNRRPEIGMSILGILSDDDNIEAQKAIYDQVLGGEAIVHTNEYGPQESRQTYEVRYNPIEVEGEIIGLTIYAENVTERHQVQQRLEESKRKLEFALSSAHIGYWEWDLEQNSGQINDEWARNLGYEPEELRSISQVPTKDLFHPDDQPIVQQLMGQLTEGATTHYHVTPRLRHKSGQYIPFMSRAEVLDFGISGKPKKIVGIDINIQELVQKDEAIRKSEEKYRYLVEHFPKVLWSSNSSGDLTFVNEVGLQTFGRTEEELLGGNWLEVIHPDDRERVLELWTQTTSTQTTFVNEQRMKIHDGSYHWFHVSAFPQKNHQGEIIQWVGLSLDIQADKEREIDLEKAQTLGKMGYWRLNLIQDQLDWSSYIFEMFEIDPGKFEPSYEFFLQTIHPEDREMVDQAYHTHLQSQEPYEIEHRLLLKGGNIKWVLERCSSVFAEDGTPLQSVGTVQDITERKAFEQELQKNGERWGNAEAIGRMGYWEWDAKTNQISWSKVLFDIYERSVEEGAPSMEEVMAYMARQEFAEQLEQFLDRAIAHGESYMMDYQIDVPSGRKYLKAIGYPQQNDKQEIVSLHGIAQDITPTKMLEMNLIEQQEYLRILTDHASDGIIACDKEFNIVYSNEQFQRWIGKHSLDLPYTDRAKIFGFHTFDGFRLLEIPELPLYRAFQEENVHSARFSIHAPDREPIQLEYNGAAMYDSEGQKIGAMIVLRDITDRINQETLVNNAFLEGMEEERAHIAAELHDNIAQTLGIAKMNLNNLELEVASLKDNQRLRQMRQMLDRSIQSTRELSHQITPVSIGDFGLVLSIEELLEEITRTTSISVDYQYNKQRRVEEDVELNVFRIIQEAVQNVLKHSEATELKVTLQFDKRALRVEIADNGIGLNEQDPMPATIPKGIGILGMQNRARRIKGRLDIHSGNPGTHIELEIPLTPASDD